MQFWRHKKITNFHQNHVLGGKEECYLKKIQNTAKQHVFKVAAAIWRMCHLCVSTPTKDSTDIILSTLHPDRPLGRYSGHLVLRRRQKGRWGMGQGRGRGEEERRERVQGGGGVWYGILQMQRSYLGKRSRATWGGCLHESLFLKCCGTTGFVKWKK